MKITNQNDKTPSIFDRLIRGDEMSMAFETVILRFRDLVTAEGETIDKHIAVIKDFDYVWWG